MVVCEKCETKKKELTEDYIVVCLNIQMSKRSKSDDECHQKSCNHGTFVKIIILMQIHKLFFVKTIISIMYFHGYLQQGTLLPSQWNFQWKGILLSSERAHFSNWGRVCKMHTRNSQNRWSWTLPCRFHDRQSRSFHNWRSHPNRKIQLPGIVQIGQRSHCTGNELQAEE